MSKSKGNVIYADDLAKRFGVDAVRHYLLSEMPYAQDGTITYENFINRYNSELANTLGNLVNRTVAMVHKYFDGEILPPEEREEVDQDLIQTAKETVANVKQKMNELRVADAIGEIWNLVRRSNKYIDETMPWALAKDGAQKKRLQTVLYHLVETIRIIAVMLASMMPETSGKIVQQIGAQDVAWESIETFGKTKPGSHVGEAAVLFERLDEKKVLEQLHAQEPQKQKKKLEEKAPKAEYITIDDFAKVEMKVGEVLESKKVVGADKLLVSKIKIGEEVRQIVSGIAAHYNPAEFVGKKVIVVTNLKPVKLRGVLSEGMILAASNGEKLYVCTPDGDIDPGAQVR